VERDHRALERPAQQIASACSPKRATHLAGHLASFLKRTIGLPPIVLAVLLSEIDDRYHWTTRGPGAADTTRRWLGRRHAAATPPRTP